MPVPLTQEELKKIANQSYIDQSVQKSFGVDQDLDVAFNKVPAPDVPAPPPPADSGFQYDFATGSDFDKTIQSLLTEAGQTAETVVDEDQIRRDVLKQFQGEIDATNVIYDEILADTRLRGASREGSGRALQFAGGLRGSARGQAQTEGILDVGKGERDAVAAERSAAIGNIMRNVRSSTLARVTEERQAKQQGADAYLELIGLQEEKTSGAVNDVVASLVAQGIDINDLSQGEMEELSKNLRVAPQKIQQAYQDATAESRAAGQASSREAAIVSLYSQGIKDPSELFNLINYNEAGERVGDISVEEIGNVLDDVSVDEEDNTFTLTQGQKRFRTLEDGTVEEVAFNPKTYAPTTKKDEEEDFYDVGDQDILSFEEWSKTDAAAGVLNDAQESEGQSFVPEKATATLKEAYDGIVAEVKKAPRSLGKISTTQKNDLQQAGLSGSDSNAQNFYLNSPSAFKDYYSRQLSLGNVEKGASAQEISGLLDLYEKEKESSKEDDLETLLAGLRAAQ